jgi:hypothetical protein
MKSAQAANAQRLAVIRGGLQVWAGFDGGDDAVVASCRSRKIEEVENERSQAIRKLVELIGCYNKVDPTN